MNKDLLLSDLSRLLELDKGILKDNLMLNQVGNWDSLTVVSIVAAIDQHYNLPVKGTDLLNCKCIGDIFSLIEKASHN